MAIAYENSGVFGSDFASTVGGSFNAGTNGDRLVVVLALTDRGGATTISSATYGGVAMTAHTADTHTSGYDYRLFYLADAASGSNTLTVTFSDGNTKPKCVAAAYSGVDGAAPVSGLTNADGPSSTPSWTVTSATGELVVVVAAMSPARTAVVPASPAVERLDTQIATSGFYGWVWEEEGASSVTINGTVTGGNAEWFGTAFSIKAASAAAASGVPLRSFPLPILNF